MAIIFLYCNGEYIPENSVHLSIGDRSFRFGDGIFDTALVAGGKVIDLLSHMERLQRGIDTFGFDVLLTDIPQICDSLLTKNAVDEGYVRILISRGTNAPGAMGYLPKDCSPQLIVQTIPTMLPTYKAISLYVSSIRAFYHLPCKTTSAMHYTQAMREADAHHCDNALMLTPEGYIAETGSGNLFWIKGNTLYTPSTDLPFIQGTIRKKVLALWEGDIREGHYTPSALRDAEEIFMSNVGHIIASVTSIAPIDIHPPNTQKTQILRKRLIDRMLR